MSALYSLHIIISPNNIFKEVASLQRQIQFVTCFSTVMLLVNSK